MPCEPRGVCFKSGEGRRPAGLMAGPSLVTWLAANAQYSVDGQVAVAPTALRYDKGGTPASWRVMSSAHKRASANTLYLDEQGQYASFNGAKAIAASFARSSARRGDEEPWKRNYASTHKKVGEAETLS